MMVMKLEVLSLTFLKHFRHNDLIFRLQEKGVLGNLLKDLKRFLANTKESVLLNGQSFSWTNVKAGVCQGSILALFLFLIF